ncbi:hypothetical protein [Corynebacterium halotolerans]|uniref:ABC transporter ATP-binding protein n=1 Tax=Corynebacterium halotolerans YIM 70093 = DSM 44683 TaxID=1121362 RepID=M1P7H4_9CORY|nr:hypothetical protein [Corynebacterium halotolerans]AGF72596.1 hypothetical protein A605_07970 [Corynebacterium halotolerans YIM 70093 = DSM 44683]
MTSASPHGHRLVAQHLELGDDQPFDLSLPATGLTLVQTRRESRSTTLALTLAGRMRVKGGTVTLHDAAGTTVADTPRHRTRRVALAGVPEIDGLERLVPVRTVVREQLAWTGSWFARTPRDMGDTDFSAWAGLLGLTVEPGDKVGDLPPAQRLRLRIMLALLARPRAGLLLIDDIDQLRSLADRRDLLRDLRQVAQRLPVTVFSSNPDLDGLADTVVDLTGPTPERPGRETGDHHAHVKEGE